MSLMITLDKYAPNLAKEWDSEANEKGPSDYLPFSNAYVYWRCARGHSWRAKINNRVRSHTGCPVCSNKIVLPGENDLKTLYPWIAEEWHGEKNGDLSPDQVLPKSNRYVWWKCKHGHEWRTKIHHRTEGNNCPVCAGNRVFAGLNDLKTQFPDVADLWDYEKNESKKPSDVTAHSHSYANWKCPKGHEWRAQVQTVTRSYQRNGQRTGCPFCAGKIVCDDNSLAFLRPELASEWNYTKNAGLTPDTLTPFAQEKVWWTCGACGHQWQAKVNNRARGTGCPKCAHTVVSEDNCLEKNAPLLAKEWDYLKNAPLAPRDVAVQSNLKFWWICSKGHSWPATVSNRSVLGEGCPFCNHRLPVKGANDFATIFPELLGEWAYDKNEKQPDEYLSGSNAVVWWRCKEGHEWQGKISSRVEGLRCPVCYPRIRYNKRY